MMGSAARPAVRAAMRAAAASLALVLACAQSALARHHHVRHAPSLLAAVAPVTSACPAHGIDPGLFECRGWVNDETRAWTPKRMGAGDCKPISKYEQLFEQPSNGSLRAKPPPLERRFLLLVPSAAAARRHSGTRQPLPLVVIGPDTGRDPMGMVVPRAVSFADDAGVLGVVLSGVDDAFNVARDCRASAGRPDDVGYAVAVLRYVASRACVDPRSIFCAGYSRGGRFCARLASQAPDLVAAIAPIASLRYPRPNNSTRPIPVVAFHGSGAWAAARRRRPCGRASARVCSAVPLRARACARPWPGGAHCAADRACVRARVLSPSADGFMNSSVIIFLIPHVWGRLRLHSCGHHQPTRSTRSMAAARRTGRRACPTRSTAGRRTTAAAPTAP